MEVQVDADPDEAETASPVPTRPASTGYAVEPLDDAPGEPEELSGQAAVARRGLGRGLGAILPARASVPLELVGLGASRPVPPRPQVRRLSPIFAAGELVEALDRALVSAEADGRMVAVVVLGVDGFRHVNTAFGREIGDAMLQALGERLLRSRRQGDLVGRLRGDEFAVVCTQVDNALGARRAVERAIGEFDVPIAAAGAEHRLQATFGLALSVFGDADSSAPVLLRRAELAMRRAKDVGLRWAVFTPQRDGYQPPRWNTSDEDRRGLDDEIDGGSAPPPSPRSTAPR